MAEKKYNCAILGATGYGAEELIRLLSFHPEVGEIFLGSNSSAGQTVASVFPNFIHLEHLHKFQSSEEAYEAASVIFSAQPAGLAEPWALRAHADKKLFIDLSGDFRFGADETTYTHWYKKNYGDKKIHAEAIYGLPELNRENIKTARIIANPGCYPTAAILGLMPLLSAGLANTHGIIIDAVSGLSGAGRELKETSHFIHAHDSISPYGIGNHRHSPEINMILSQVARKSIKAIFTPHLAPMGRGIVATIYANLHNPMSAQELHQHYNDFYLDEQFVRVLPEGCIASNRNIKQSNYCDISVHCVPEQASVIIVASIDNMVKGASGQAIQNMNIALDLPESLGLLQIPAAF